MALPQILQQLNGTAPMANPQLQQSINQIRSLTNIVSSSPNPQAAMLNLASQNPQVRDALDLSRKLGNSPKEAFYKLAEQRGVDPNDIINALT
jgi:hypothetical protein